MTRSYPAPTSVAPAARRRKTRHRGNGEGSLYQTPAGTWRASFAWTDAAGRLHRLTATRPTHDEARGKLAELRAVAGAGATGDRSVSVAEYLDRWLEAQRQRIRPATWRGREGQIRNYLVPALGRVRLVDLRPGDVEAMTAGMVDRGLSARTANHTRATLRKALSDAVRHGLVPRNVASIARGPRVPGRQIEYFTPDQLRTLLTASWDVPAGDPTGMLVIVTASLGLRPAEVLGLSWEDVDRAAGTVTIRRSLALDWDGGRSLGEVKTERSRRVLFLPDVARRALDRRDREQDAQRIHAGDWWTETGLVFTRPDGRALRGDMVSRAFRGLVRSLGLPPLPFRVLRHSYATAALAGGVPLAVVSEQLGHSGLAITAQHYAAIAPPLRRDAAAAIDRLLGDAS